MNWALLQNSLLVGVLTTAISVALGFVSALWLAGLPQRLRPVFVGMAVLALALPPFLVTNSWLDLLGQTGSWHRWLAINIFSLGGTIWVLSLMLWPITLLLVWGAWQKLEPAHLESDMALTGKMLVQALLFPLARGALAQSVLLTLVLALNNFAVPTILQVKVFPAEMWIRFNTQFDTLGALRVSWPLVLGPLLLMFWLTRREVPWPSIASPVSGRLFRQQLGQVWFWSGGLCALVVCLCSVAVPIVQIISARRTWTELPGALAAGASAVWNSFWYAALTATIILGVSLWIMIVARSAGNSRPRLQRGAGDKLRQGPLTPAHSPSEGEWEKHRHVGNAAQITDSSISARLASLGRGIGAFFRVAAWLAFLLPGVLLGIGLIHAFNHSWSSMFYQSAMIVILAFGIRYFVIGWHAVVHATQRVDRDLIDVGLLEGATRPQMFRLVIWPQAARTVLVTWYIVFLLCLWDVESMILVVPPGGETLALRIFNLLHYGHNAQVNALCFTLLGVALVPLLAGALWRGAHWIWNKLIRARAGSFESLTRAVTSIALPGLLLANLLLFTACAPSSGRAVLESKIFEHVQVFGSRGVGVGQLNKPRSVAVDNQDNLYVVDMTGRVQKFSPDGSFLLSWQMPQTDLGKPKGMGRDRDGNIVVVEPHYSRVNIFSPMGKLLAQWGSHGTNLGQLSLPRAVAVNSRSEYFVSEYQEAERVQKFMFHPGNARGGGSTDSASLLAPPVCTCSFGEAGTAPGQFNRPEGLCTDSQDRVYVADSCNHRIQIFSSDGHFLRTYGKAGHRLGELSYPYDICVDPAGRQYVCEFGNSRIQVFDDHDQPIEIIGAPGATPGRFSNPWGVALDSAGNLYVADSQNHRVQKLVRRK